MKIVAKNRLSEVFEYPDDVLKSKNMPDAVTKAHSMISVYEDTNPRLAKFLSDNLGDAMTFLTFPVHHHRKIRSTNVLERFNKELKRRTKVVGAFFM
jgi:transposase-like protein